MRCSIKNKKVVCPFCEEEQSISYRPYSNVNGVVLECENNECKKEFELFIEGGFQILFKS